MIRASTLTFIAALALAGLLALSACGGSSSEADEGIASLDEVETVSTDPVEPADAGPAEGSQAAGASEESDDASQPAEEDVAPGNAEDAFLALAQCLRDEGLEVEDPDSSGGGGGGGPGGILRGTGIDRSDPDVQAAFEECGSLLDGIRPEFDPEQQAERQDARLAFARCLRDQGLDVADPDGSGGAGPGGGGGGIFRGAGLDPSDPDVQAAIEQCRDEVPGFGGRGGPGGRFGGPRQ